MPDNCVSDLSDEQLVKAAIYGDTQAQTALWQKNRKWLAAVIYSYKPRDMELEDIMQEVAIKFVSKLNTLREASAFKSWLRKIAVNTARETARSRKPITQFADNPDYITNNSDNNHSDFNAVHDEAHSLLEHAKTLPAEFREPLLLRCIRGLGCKQIAEILNLPVTTIETRLTRGRRMLRDEWIAKTDKRLDKLSVDA